MKLKIEIPQGVNELLNTLQLNGHWAYITGSCVRDVILNKRPNSWNICTSATLKEILNYFKNNKIIKTGLQYGMIAVVNNNVLHEIATYNIEGDYTDVHRSDKGSIPENLIRDLKRRDFTINAMAYNDHSGLIDLFGGIEDLQNGIIKCVGNAEERFAEDGLRILRCFRYLSQLGFTYIEDSTGKAAKKLADKLNEIPAERINDELCKLLSGKLPHVIIGKYKEIFGVILPEIKSMWEFNQNNPYHIYTVWKHTLVALEHTPNDLIIRLAVLLHDIGKPHSYQVDNNGIGHFKGHGRVSADIAKVILHRLKFDEDTQNQIVELIYYHDATFEANKKYIRRWINKIGVVQYKRLLELKTADVYGQNPIYLEERLKKITKIESLLVELISEEKVFSVKSLNISGKDLIEIGYMPGKLIGDLLDTMAKQVVDGKLENDKEALISYAVKNLREN